MAILQNCGHDSGHAAGARFKLVLFLLSLLCLALWSGLRSRPVPIADLSGGKYPETFRTRHVPLQHELTLLAREGVFRDHPAPEFEMALNALNLPESGEDASAFSADSPEYGRIAYLIRRQFSRNAFLYSADDSGKGSAFNYLLHLFENSSDPDLALEVLRLEFMMASISLRSNLADLYFLKTSLDHAELFRTRFGAGPKLSALMTEVRAYPFPVRSLYLAWRTSFLATYEDVRRDGLDSVVGGISLGASLSSPGEFFHALGGAFTNFFYDADRDEAMTLLLYRDFLSSGILRKPNRKLSIWAYRNIQETRVEYETQITRLNAMK